MICAHFASTCTDGAHTASIIHFPLVPHHLPLFFAVSPSHTLQASSVTSMDVNQLRDALHTAAAESSALRAELAVQTAAAQDAALQAKQVSSDIDTVSHTHTAPHVLPVCLLCTPGAGNVCLLCTPGAGNPQ